MPPVAELPGFLLAGTHSGCGKSTLCAGLLRAFARRGLRIAPFKVGPDYLDPMLHRAAAGQASWNLDPWFLDEHGLREAYSRGGQGADMALVEGVMGLFDGARGFEGSSADLALRLGLPVVLVMDAAGVGASAAATVLGHARLDPRLRLAGVIFNRVGSAGHFQLLKGAVESHTGVKALGWLAPGDWAIPERHLGLHQPREVSDLDVRLDRLAEALEETVDLEALRALAAGPERVPCPPSTPSGELTVALARDEAFAFTYADTLDRLARLGVRWVPFSPLRERMPEGVAGLYLPGGYPELHAELLSRNGDFFEALRRAHAQGLPIFAECGGYMVLGEALMDPSARSFPMAGLVPGRARMTDSLQSFGYRRLEARAACLFGPAGTVGKGHEFHHSVWEGESASPAWRAEGLTGHSAWMGHVEGKLLASYAHVHFGANPAWAEAWVAAMRGFATRAHPCAGAASPAGAPAP